MSVNLSDPEVQQPSLFSLELVVDTLHLDNVTCRFPAVAFRLLDFPTIIIYHVEHDLAKTIKRKLSLEPNYKVPPRIHELMDKNGAYQIKKGKSCLFKLSTETLYTHLTNTPLYVMIIDTYPEVAKLLGSCSVPLDNAMIQVYKDIQSQGLSMPAVYGNKGSYKVYNLMGVEIGHITLGYRLLSLGQGLIQHIPDNVITKAISKNVETAENVDTSVRSSKHGDIIIQDLESVDKNVQVAVSEPKKHVSIGTDNIQETLSTQTQKKQKKRFQSEGLGVDIDEEIDELYVTNTICPPPLFYNSEAEPQIFHSSMKRSATALVQETNAEFLQYDSDSSCDTLRDDASVSALDYRYTDETVAKRKEKGIRPTYPKSQGLNLQQLPLLNALLGEILTLQNPNIPKELIQQQLKAQRSSRSPSPVSVRSPQQMSPRPQKSSVSETQRENREEFLARLSSPKHREHSPEGRCGHKKCSVGLESVPKTKSWLRKQPPLAVKKSKNKLTYGMTNTQRLRLAQGNPEMLKELKEKEEQRKKERKIFQQTQNLQKQPQVQRGRIPNKTQKQMRNATYNRFKGVESNKEQKSHKKPVPTPRHIVKLENSDQNREAIDDTSDKKIIEKDKLSPPMGIERENTFYEDESVNSVKYTSSNTQSRIEVHVPSITEQRTSDESYATAEESDWGDDGNKNLNKTKTLAVPGLALDAITRGSYESKSSAGSQYQDDFENGKHESPHGGTPFLQRIVDKYSDSDESNSERSQRSRGSKGSKHSHASNKSSNAGKSGRRPELSLTYVAPRSSEKSPVVHEVNPMDSIPTREPVIPSSPSEAALSMDQVKDLTRKGRLRMTKSISVESDIVGRGSPDGFRRPRPSPRHRDSNVSIRTDSVSSYAPSDDDYHFKDENEYSDAFETLGEESEGEDDDFLGNIKPMKELSMNPQAKLGYTWAGN